MDTVLRALVIYIFLLLIFRISGKRSLAEITTFDLVLLLVIGGAVQPGLVGQDYSIANAFLAIITLLAIDTGLALLVHWLRPMGKWINGAPLVIVEDGHPLKDRMDKMRVDETDVLARARQLQGLERMDQIKYAVLERSGGISIIPKRAD